MLFVILLIAVASTFFVILLMPRPHHIGQQIPLRERMFERSPPLIFGKFAKKGVHLHLLARWRFKKMAQKLLAPL